MAVPVAVELLAPSVLAEPVALPVAVELLAPSVIAVPVALPVPVELLPLQRILGGLGVLVRLFWPNLNRGQVVFNVLPSRQPAVPAGDPRHRPRLQERLRDANMEEIIVIVRRRIARRLYCAHAYGSRDPNLDFSFIPTLSLYIYRYMHTSIWVYIYIC